MIGTIENIINQTKTTMEVHHITHNTACTLGLYCYTACTAFTNCFQCFTTLTRHDAIKILQISEIS